MGEGLMQIASGLFGNSGAPYEDMMDMFKKYFGQAQSYQKPFFEAGKNSIAPFQDWLSGMKDPSAFIGKLMGGYEQSPYARNLTNTVGKSLNNFNSASGLLGSTAASNQMADYSKQIASGDMQSWLQNVLGINKEYGGGLDTLIGRGQNSANSISQLLAQLGGMMGQGAFSQRAGENQDFGNIIGGAGKLLFG